MANQVKDTVIINRQGIPNNYISQMDNTHQTIQSPQQGRVAAGDMLLLKVRPSWWNYFWYLFFCWLVVPLIIAIWKRAGLLLSVYENTVVLERGVLSKHTTQVLLSDIRSVDIRQGIWQRICRVGDILIGTAGMGGYEIIAQGLPDPNGIVNLILQQRQRRGGTSD